LVNLAPADMKKEGASFDLPIALCMLSASGQIDGEKLGRCMILGELALDGSVRPVRGVVSIALLARQFSDIDIFIIPYENIREASVAA